MSGTPSITRSPSGLGPTEKLRITRPAAVPARIFAERANVTDSVAAEISTRSPALTAYRVSLTANVRRTVCASDTQLSASIAIDVRQNVNTPSPQYRVGTSASGE